MNEKEDLIFIEHIIDSIDAIADFSKEMSKGAFLSSRLKQSAIVREIEIIGEAAKNISEKLKKEHSEIEWKEISATRDKMIHHYFGVDLDIIWNIIKKNLPELKKQVLKIRDQLK